MPADTATVHAVVVHHRGPQRLARCVETLLASEGVDLRLAVVANACPEPVPAAVLDHPRVHVLHCAVPLGFGAANNRGAELLRGRFGRPDGLYFLNDDTASEAGALAALVDHLRRQPACAVVGPRLMIDGTDLVNSLGLALAVTGEAWDEGLGRRLDTLRPLPTALSPIAVTGTAMLVRTDVFEQLGGWAELFHFYYEDVDLCLRARALGGTTDVLTAAVVHHAVSATAGRDSDFKRYHILRNRLLLLALHWPAGLLAHVVPRLLLLETARLLARLGRGALGLIRVQLRAWVGLARLLPAALRARAARPKGAAWRSLLRPASAIPAVRLSPAEAPA